MTVIAMKFNWSVLLKKTTTKGTDMKTSPHQGYHSGGL